jgi:hypothetical protein
LHTISFENTDQLIPTDNPAVAAWTSFAANDFDGLNCLVYVDKDIVYIQPLQITFDTVPFDITYYVAELADLDEFHLVNNQHGFAIHARKIYSSACPQGVFTGEWVKADNSGTSGSFQARWFTSNSTVYGIMAGAFWTEPNGIRKFEGVVCPGALTVISYYVYGTWYYDDPSLCPVCGSGHGYMVGFYTDSNNTFKGFIKGEFGLPASTDLHLPLNGKWIEACDNSIFAGIRWIQ